MEIKNNFLSVVTVGSFNPAILTPEFLKEQKVWISEEYPPEGTSSPVVSDIKFGDIAFFVELERFQVMHHNVERLDKSPVVEAAHKYLKVLRYTPVLLQGINFNVTIVEYEKNKAINALLEDPIHRFADYFEKAEEYLLDLKTVLREGISETQSTNCKFYVKPGISISSNLRRADTNLVLNYNWEVKDIKTNNKRLNIIPESYEDIHKGFMQFIERLRG